jgi:uncharacterized protein YlaI
MTSTCPDCVTFTTLSLWECTGEEICSLCQYHLAVLDYHLDSDDENFRPLHGYCCAECAANLLVSLEKLQRARIGKIDFYPHYNPTN